MSAAQTVTKAEFARIIGVSGGRVTQMISEGKIGAEALEGDGPRARIRVDVARAQIRERTNVGQSLGNGLDTRLDVLPFDGDDGEPGSPARTAGNSIENQIKAERLRQLRHANELDAEERLLSRGTLIRSDQAAAAMGKVAARMLTVMEASLGELADTLAAAHKLDRRAVLHSLRQAWRATRAKAADAARREADALPLVIEEQVPDASDPAEGQA